MPSEAVVGCQAEDDLLCLGATSPPSPPSPPYRLALALKDVDLLHLAVGAADLPNAGAGRGGAPSK